MTVVYFGHRYKVRFWHGVLYTMLKVWLFIVRIFRRAKKSVSFLTPVLLLIPAWAVFITFLWITGENSIVFYLNESKYSIFTSVVITAIVRLQGEISEYRKNIRVQHDLYVSLMYDTEKLIEIVFERIVRNNKRVDFINHPLYTYGRFDKLRKTLDNNKNKIINNPKLNADIYIENIVNDIDEIKDKSKFDRLWVKDDTGFDIEYAYMCVKEFQDKNNQSNLDLEAIENVIWALYTLVNKVRYPWRKDHFVDMILRRIIVYNTPNSKDRGYYLNLYEVK